MPRKTSATQILGALEKEGVDMYTFTYKYTSGRLWNDYQIMQVLGCNIISEVYSEINRYMAVYRNIYTTSTISALKVAGWLTPTAIRKAKAIKQFYEGERIK